MSVLLATLLIGHLSAVSVPGGSGSAARIQAVLDACPATNCLVELPDADYPLDRQLWINDRAGVTIRSSGTKPAVLRWEDSLLSADSSGTAKLFRSAPPSGGGRPELPSGWLRWPVSYSGGVGSATDTGNAFSVSGHQNNGMILVRNARTVRVEGLVLDGVKPAVFVNQGIWDGMYDVVHGSVGVGIVSSRDVAIVDCEIRNFWAASYINDRNMSCASWTGGAAAKPWSACGAMGGHLVERNRIHGNKFGIYFEASWDVGSIVRDNIAWDNWDHASSKTGSTVTPKVALLSSENNQYPGGFLLVKDVVFPAHVVTRNTVSDTVVSVPFGCTYYRSWGNTLWSGNLVSQHGWIANQAANPLQRGLHVFTVASYPHVWDMGILSDGVGMHEVTTGRMLDTALRWKEVRRFVTDTVEGRLPDGQHVVIGFDSVDTVIAGVDTTLARIRWGTLVYDTTTVDVDCKSGCQVTLVNGFSGETNQFPQIWRGRLPGSDSFDLPVNLPTGVVETRRVWLSGIVDSTTRFTLPEKDTSAWRVRNLVWSSNSYLKSSNATDFLALDTALPGSKRLVRLLGMVPGARGRDGRVGQERIRLRARGHGRWDAIRQELVLPVAIDGDLAGISKLVVRRHWIVARPMNTDDRDYMGGNGVVERRLLPSSLPDVAPGDSVIRIPLAGVGTDSMFQVDLWLDGIARTDTVAATPMAWSVALPMAASQTTSGALRPRTPAQWFRRGQFLYVDAGLADVEFVDARGARVRLPVVGAAVDLATLRPGLWVPVLPGSRPVVSIGGR